MKNITIAKKSFFIAAIIQLTVVIWLYFLISTWGGHTVLTFGMLIQFPASMVGILIGELLQAITGSGEFSVSAAIIITVILQYLIVTSLIHFVLKKRNI